MIDWRGIKDVSKLLFGRLVGIPIAHVHWSDESEGSDWVASPHLEIEVTDEGAIGWDEERRAANGDNDVTVVVCGPRTFTLSVACESLTADAADPECGSFVLGNLVTRLRRSTSIEQLAPHYAISDMTRPRRVPYRDEEGRLINRYVVDLLCLTADNDTDRTVGAGGWIGEVIGTGTVTISEGNTITVPLDVEEP